MQANIIRIRQRRSFMHTRTLAFTLTAGLIAASSAAVVHAQQNGAMAAHEPGVISETPVYSSSMLELRHAAQRLRETIQALAQEPVGSGRAQAMSDARKALYDTQQAMLRLPEEYRVSGYVTSNAPVYRTSAAQNRTFGGAMQDLQLAADRLHDAIQSMAALPAGAHRNGAIRQAHEALAETQQALSSVPDASSGVSTASAGWPHGDTTAATATGSTESSAGGTVSGTVSAGSDASRVSAEVPAVAGGVGLDARAMLSSEARPEHDLKLVFALDTGNYLADLAVKVTDANGRTVIDGVSDGPWLYAKLPPGNYTATAMYKGESVTRRFNIGSSGQRIAYFRWPASVERVATAGVTPILGTGPESMR
jgi:hypothetical protein